MALIYRDHKRKAEKKLDKKQDKRQQFRAVITDALGNQSGAGSIWFDRAKRKVWAMPNGGTQPYPYYCYRIKPVIGLGVIIGYSSPLNQLPEVLQTDTEFLGPSNTTGTAYEAPDNEDFLPGGRLQLWLDTRLIQSLAISPVSGSLMVNVINGDYIYQNERKTFAGQANVDLSGSQPAGPNEHLYVGLYLDSSNALQTVDGATVATSATAPEPTWPTGSYRLGMVLLDDTQTSFSMADDIVNLKIPWTDEESFSSGAWPNAGEIKIGDTIYPTLAAAQAVAVSPNVVKLGEGSYPASGLVFATGVSLASAGNATITQTSDANCLTLTNATIRGINFSVSINSANTRSTLTFVDTCYAYNVRIAGSNAGAGVVDGFAYADTDEVYLGDCEAIVDGDAVNINNVDAIVTIANGIYSGGTGGIEVVAGFANLLFPHVASNNVTANPASRGQWFDSTSNTRVETQARFQDSSVTAPIRITERATAPSAPATGDIYLDDGTNTGTGNPCFRRYTGAAWENVGAGSGSPDASETVKGIAELATQTETNTGTDDLRIVTPLKLNASTTVVHPARTISTTAPLTGGGDLSANRTLALSIPSFSVHKNGTDQTGIVTATFTKLTWSTEEFDTHNWFASDKYTPQLAGKYFFILSAYFTAAFDQAAMNVYLYKNGTYVKGFTLSASGTVAQQPSGFAILQANGSTDYFEAYAYQTTGSDKTILGDTLVTFFQGYYVGS